jgi:CRP-like cAMP-binding protein
MPLSRENGHSGPEKLSWVDDMWGVRSADVEAKVDTDLYLLSRSRFNELARADAAMGVQVFARLALSIAESLRQTDAELSILEER